LRTQGDGRGHVLIERIGGRSAITRMSAHSPLRLLAPRASGECVWVFSSTFGGGLLAGDKIEMDLETAARSSCLLSTQSQTKVFKCEQGQVTESVLTARVGEEATLICLPDASMCFRDAAFRQTQRIELCSTSSLCWLDWFTSGRRACGERWAFRSFTSCMDLLVDSKLVFRDALRLDASDGTLDDPHRMGLCDCFATAVLVGPRFMTFATEILAQASSQPVVAGSSLFFAVSPLRDGLVLRIAGPSTESVGRWIRNQMTFVPLLLGNDPWARKW